jgi:indole-3-glycerol phosphate synthase
MPPFIDALLGARVPVIMELKPRAADGEDLFQGRSPGELVAGYEAAGAPCLSVVTGRWFGGTTELLREVTASTDLPVLQKDFLTNARQLRVARDLGASAVLLTASLLPRSALARLVDTALSLGLTPFIEVTSEAEIATLPSCEACVVAVNNKDIRDRERGTADIERSLRLLPAVRRTGTRCPVSASGIDRADIATRLLGAGFAGLLVGTGLLRAADLADGLSAGAADGAPDGTGALALRPACAAVRTVDTGTGDRTPDGTRPDGTDTEECAMQLPTLDDSIELLKEVSGVDQIDPDTPLQSSEVDSLNLVEWVYQMQERHPELAIDEAIVDDVDEATTFRAIHERVGTATVAEAAGS